MLNQLEPASKFMDNARIKKGAIIMTYYSTRKTILKGEPQLATNKYGDRRQMERQIMRESFGAFPDMTPAPVPEAEE